MNAFADTLLSLLFGWLRALVEGLWSSIASARFQHTLSWLGDHWLWLVILLCLICTVLDYLIWLVRWRPYIIWRDKLRRLMGKESKLPPPEEVFFDTWNEGVDVDLSDMLPPPVQTEIDYAAWQQPVYEEPVLEDPLYEEPAVTEAETFYHPVSEISSLPDVPVQRKRRSQRHEKKKLHLFGLLPTADEEEAAMLDGLPPAVNKSQAFHAPVYPGQYDKSQG